MARSPKLSLPSIHSVWTISAGLRSGVWGVFDQVLISITNFVTMILVARAVDQRAFGAFVLVYTLLLFVNSLQNSLITQPHNVLGVTLQGDNYARYTASAALGQILLIIALAFIVGSAAAYALVVDWTAAALLAALVPAIVAWQAQEFVRRVLYTEGRIGAALANDLVAYGGQIIALAIIWRLQWLSGPNALLMLATTSALAAAFGLWNMRQTLRVRPDIVELRKSLAFGKWLTAAAVAYWLSTQLYLLLSAPMLNVQSTGALRATQNVVAPSNLVTAAFQTMVTPKASAEFSRGGRQALTRLLIVTTGASLVPLLVYWLIISVFSSLILDALYPADYSNYGSLVPLFCIGYFVTQIARGFSVGLTASQRPHSVFYGQLAAVLAAAFFGIPMIAIFGINGAVFAYIASQLVTACSFAVLYVTGEKSHAVLPTSLHFWKGRLAKVKPKLRSLSENE